MKTLTPLWTGGVETGRMERIHETGIMGSLRWWYEAIVRGLGADICNPTSDQPGDRCPCDGGNYCHVCQIFGATGRRRGFRLRIRDGSVLFKGNARDILIPSGRIHQPRAGGWYLMANSVIGDQIRLRVVPLADPGLLAPLRLVLSVIDRHSAIGAKVSNGYGVAQFRENDQLLHATLDSLPTPSQSSRQHGLPDIRDFFFATFRFQEPQSDQSWWQRIRGIAEALGGQVSDNNQRVNVYRNRQQLDQARTHLQNVVGNGLLPLAPAVRNWLRFHWKSALTVTQKDYLFGTIRPKLIASKVNVSHAYKLGNDTWEFRVWGWVPCQPQGLQLNRDQFLDELRTTLTNITTWEWVFGSTLPVPGMIIWHSLDCHERDGLAYLKELLGLNEGGAP